jgi:hypothetical protein
VSAEDLEVRFNWVSVLLVALFGLAFVVGLILHVQRPGSPPASLALHSGLVLLMLSPATRLLIALIERIRRRDWTFMLMTLVVAAELAVVMWRASARD